MKVDSIDKCWSIATGWVAGFTRGPLEFEEGTIAVFF